MNTMTIRPLLECLHLRNSSDPELRKLFPQSRRRPVRTSQIVAIDGVTRWELSPQLEERFEYCDRWTNAYCGQTWLGIGTINNAMKRPALAKAIRLRHENYERCVLRRFPWDRVSIFAADLKDFYETYLVWGRAREPRIFAFHSVDEGEFKDLRSYLKFVTAG